MDEDRIGAGVFFKIAGICVGFAVIAIVALMIFWRAAYALGFFGAFIGLAVLLVAFGWIYDRRHPRAEIS
jgi:hypothetical protein